jgi:FxsC-like protein
VPYFFLSYAHTPRHGRGSSADPDVWASILFRDLCNEIRSLTGSPPGATVGFMDQELWRGHDWPIGLARALANCRVFVPLYSRRYFQSEHCGKEWSAFLERIRSHPARGANRAETIIPALWVPVEREWLPAVAQSIKFPHSGLGEQYAQLGFYGIMKLSRYQTEYKKAVCELAKQIVQISERSPIESAPKLDYDALPSAFGPKVGDMPGDQRVRITIAAPRRGRLPTGRGEYHYGATTRDWDPYRPRSSRPLPDHVADLVRSLGFRSDVGVLDDRAEDLLRDGPAVGPEVLIVDAWTTQLTTCRDLLSRIDAMDKPWVQVLIPWNRQDKETADAEAELRSGLDSALGRKIAEGRATSSLAVRGVPTLEDLGHELPTVIMTAVRQYLRHAQAFPPDGDAVERPRLSYVMADPVEMEHPGG